MMKDIIVCPMTESDLDQVLDIEAKSYPRPWSKAHFLEELSSPHSFPHVSFDCEGNVTGYICPMVLLDEGHILNVAVRYDLRGQGIGRLLIERVIRDCHKRGAAFVSLEVRASNAPAIRLYHNLGFVMTGTRKSYYENGEDAFLMEFIY